MVVVSIIAIMVGLAVVSVGGQADREFKNEVDKLYHKLRLVADEATLSGRELGVLLDDDNQYYFLQYDEQLMGWEAMDKDSGLLQAGTMDESTLWQLSLEESDDAEESMDLSVLYETQEKDEVKDYQEVTIVEPDIIFFSDGQITSFELELESRLVKDTRYHLVGENLLGLSLIKK